MCKLCDDATVGGYIEQIRSVAIDICRDDTVENKGKFHALSMAAVSLITAAAAVVNAQRDFEGKGIVPIEVICAEIMNLLQTKIEQSFEGVDQKKMNEVAKNIVEQMQNLADGTVH